MKTYSSLRNSNATYLFCLILFLSGYAKANDVNLPDSTSFYKTKLSFKLDNNNFFINNEYFSPVVEGYTLFGQWLNPELNLSISKEISIEAGVFANKYFGLDNYSQITPTYTVEIQKDYTLFQIGTLSPELLQLSRPLSNDEKIYSNPLYEGMYTSYTNDKLNTSIWIEWEDFLFHNENKQEVLNICTNNEIRYHIDSLNSVGFRFESIILHKGGQINANPKEDLVMTLNTGIGLFGQKQLKRSTLSLFHIYYGYRDLASSQYDIFRNGEGHLSSVQFKGESLQIGLSNWSASQYLSDRGNPIYNCKTTNWQEYPNYSDKKRNLAICSLTYTKTYSTSAEFKTGLTGYFDYINSKLDYNYWISVIINLDQNITFSTNKGY